MSRFCLALCIGLSILGNSGCGGGAKAPVVDPVAPVKGTITLDGKPLPTGELHFSTLGVPPSVLQVKDGAFAGNAPIGEDLVEAYIFIEGPVNSKYPEVPTKVNTAPVKYSGPKSLLKATVTKAGPNEFKFAMTK